jgi:alkanesulfonate monooxygenase SsuD/methylene tetrahydromethanopterin reductase-like flavin-dependent oxidoreductase (luciferase family)
MAATAGPASTGSVHTAPREHGLAADAPGPGRQPASWARSIGTVAVPGMSPVAIRREGVLAVSPHLPDRPGIRLGVFSMPAHPPHRPYADVLAEDLEMLVLADQLGYDEAWLGEHFTSIWENIPAPDLLIAQALTQTRQITLATGVSCIPNHNPAQLANRIAQLDQMARGRFLWGVGAGAVPSDAVLFEVPADGTHRQVTQENIDQILKIWADHRGDWSYHNPRFPQFNFTIPPREEWRGLASHLKPYQKPHPPIAVAGLTKSSSTLRWAGERGWIPLSTNLTSEAGLASHWQVYEQGAAANGITPRRSDWRISRDIYVANTDEQARREARAGSMARALQEYFYPLVSSVGGLDVWKIDDDMPDSDITLDYLLERFWIVGSPETVARRLAAIYEHTGGYGGVLMLAYDWEGENRRQWQRSMLLLAEEVVPRLEELVARSPATSPR